MNAISKEKKNTETEFVEDMEKMEGNSSKINMKIPFNTKGITF